MCRSPSEDDVIMKRFDDGRREAFRSFVKYPGLRCGRFASAVMVFVMQTSFPFSCARSVAVLVAVVLCSVRPAYPAESAAEARVEATGTTKAASVAAVVIAMSAIRDNSSAADHLSATNPVSTKAADGYSSPAIIVIPGPNGLTIASKDLAALDAFEQLLNAANRGSRAAPVAVFYLKHAKAEDVAAELNKILSNAESDSGSSTTNRSDSSRPKALVTGTVKITAETRLNALLVQANRADQMTVERLLRTLDLKDSPRDVEVLPKPRMIAVEHAQAQDIADVVRQVYADRVVVPQPQPQAPQGRGRGMAMLTRGMMGGGPGQRQPQQDPSKRIAIGVDTRTNTLVIAAVDPMFEEVKQLVRELDAASAEQDDAVQVVTLHRTSAIAVEQALAAYGGDAVQDYTLATNSATSRAASSNSASPPWATQGYGWPYGGQRPLGNNRMPGGSSSPNQGFGGQRRLRYTAWGRPGQ